MTEPLNGADACIIMHTALRKCCDSKITSAAYHLIQLINIEPPEQNAWRILGNMVAKMINMGLEPLVALRRAVRHLNDEFCREVVKPANQGGPKEVENARATMHALQCTLECFDETDLQGMAGYLDD